MIAVVQRVSKASVTVGEAEVAAISGGLLALVGVAREDTSRDAAYVAGKIARLRVFADSGGLMNLSVKETGGAVLLVSQFTLVADTRRGNRPSFADAADPEIAEKLYLEVARDIAHAGIEVQTGHFGEMMKVALVNDGPVTVLLDSKTGSWILDPGCWPNPILDSGCQTPDTRLWKKPKPKLMTAMNPGKHKQETGNGKPKKKRTPKRRNPFAGRPRSGAGFHGESRYGKKDRKKKKAELEEEMEEP